MLTSHNYLLYAVLGSASISWSSRTRAVTVLTRNCHHVIYRADTIVMMHCLVFTVLSSTDMLKRLPLAQYRLLDPYIMSRHVLYTNKT